MHIDVKGKELPSLPLFFFPLAANVVVCAKFDMKKEGRTTMCSCSPRRRRRRGGKEGGGGGREEGKEEREEERKKKREEKKGNEDSVALGGANSSIAIDVGSRAFFQAS